MTRTPPVVAVVALLVLSTVPAVAVGAGTTAPQQASQSATNETDRTAGAIVASGITAEGESLDGSLERGAFSTAFDSAGTDRRRAAVIADYHETATARLDRLQSRMNDLSAARANGSLGQSAYETGVDRVRTEAARLRQLAVRLENASADVDDDALAEAGVDSEALRDLRMQAASLADGADTRLGSSFDRQFFREVSTITADYNEDQPDLGIAAPLLQGNLVNFHVQKPDGTELVVSFRITDDNRITQVRAGAREGAPIRMEADREVVGSIASADSPGSAFRSAVEDGDVEIHGNGLGSGLTWTVINTVRGLLG